MLEKRCNNHLLLLASLTVARSAGFARAQVEPREQTTSLFSKLPEIFTSSGVATLSVGFNQAHDFSNTPTISEAVVTSNFASYTTTAFTYILGAGVNPHWQAGIAMNLLIGAGVN